MQTTACILVGQTLQPVFVEEPYSPFEVEINTAITLLWQVEYEGGSSCGAGGCLQLFLNTSNGHGLYDFPGERNHEIRNNLLFDAATSITPAGPNSTSNIANLQIVMFFDEFVRNNVPFLYCKAVVSLGGRTYQNSSMVNISVASIPTTLPPITSTSYPCNSSVHTMSRGYDSFEIIIAFFYVMIII